MGQEIKSKEIHFGRNFSPILDDYVRCSRCGFINKVSRTQGAPDGSRIGWGLTYEDFDSVAATYDGVAGNIEYYGGETDKEYNGQGDYDSFEIYDGGGGLGYDGIENSIKDPIRTTGCSQCGTLRYNK